MRVLVLVVALLSAAGVAVCGALPHSTSTCGPDSKITIHETVLGDGKVDDYQVYFVSDNNQVVFLRTDDGQIFRSGDEGITWEKQSVNSKMPHIEDNPFGVHLIFHAQAKDGAVTLYFLGGGGGNGRMWLSQDGGQTYTYRDTLPQHIYWLYMHPLYAGIVLARRIGEKAHEIWLSDNFGESWRKILEHLPPHGPVNWSPFADTHPHRIYASQYTSPLAHSTFDMKIVYSDDWFATNTSLEVAPHASGHVLTWWVTAPSKLVAMTCYDTKSCTARELHISEDGGKSFHTAVFPDSKRDRTQQSEFLVYEMNEAALWIAVTRQCSPASGVCYGDLFHSNKADSDFTLALEDVTPFDFTKYQSVDGIYIANQYVTRDGEAPKQGDDVQTLITFNKGSEWSALKPPAVDANGNAACAPGSDCKLHLHGFQRDHLFTWFYSVPNAPGLMLANGNVGPVRTERFDDSNTYFSRNGGVTWDEIARGPHVPEVGDHGAVLLLAKENVPSMDLLYSLTDGDEWHSCAFTSAPVHVRNIRVSQGWDSKRFLVYGRRHDERTGNDTTVLVHVNFDAAFTGSCGDGDYESWTPVDEHGQCVLGRHTSVQRRKVGHACSLPEEHLRESKTQVCACQAHDYECAHCFYRPNLQAPCTLECAVPHVPSPPSNCPLGGTYEVDMGYRLVDGDVCDAGLPDAKVPKGHVPCDFSFEESVHVDASRAGTVVVVLIVLVLVLALVGTVWYLWVYNDSFYNAVSYTLGIDNCCGRGTVDVEVYDHVIGTSLQDDGGIALDDSDDDSDLDI